MSFLFELPNIAGDVLVLSCKSIVPACWSYFIFRLVLLGSPLDLLSLLSQALRSRLGLPLAIRLIEIIEAYYKRPLVTDPAFLISTIEVLFSIYYVDLIKRVQKRFPGETHSHEELHELVRRIVGFGLQPAQAVSQGSEEVTTLGKYPIPKGGFRRFTRDFTAQSCLPRSTRGRPNPSTESLCPYYIS
ncbi:hypothetical protein CROQUDRAFT_494597 [Cronartium quercuum f. sp. fusiforme G11]|uniref:Uncharacterized protein n=1 Tax=Cronartium quercuum f. sp. fusiforme G11 TaxID=708437 RepID=A0A9P6TDP0_9BASI|nr:hypothetical protein CROQUDRAFT_494597 [Cronartium quercuum f. sp. fusiforme G11]